MKTWLLIFVFAAAVCGCGKQAASSSGEVTLDDLNRAYFAISMRAGRRPTNIDELMTFPTLRGKTLPKPPAGKKIALDSRAGCVVFVDQ